MSIFENARKVSVYGGSLMTQTSTHHHTHEQDTFNLLKEKVNAGAQHDSAERYDPPKCHPGTRVAIMDRINAWALATDETKPVMWLNGAAGAGKSAIAQTLAERWSEASLLAASYFFSRTVEGRNNKTALIATLAYQITLSFPLARIYVENAIRRDPMIFGKSLMTQMTHLIIHPLIAPHTEVLKRKIIVIDGLDECSATYSGQKNEEQQREILEAIAFAAQHNLPIRFLVSSRPELQPRESFGKEPLKQMTSRSDLNQTLGSNADIELFLRHRFTKVTERNAYLGSWPPNNAISLLVNRSSGHFIYPSTVMRYIDSPRADPAHNLEIVLGRRPNDAQMGDPFAELDALYSAIMQSVAPASQSAVYIILGIMAYNGTLGVRDLESHLLFPEIKYQSPEYFEKLFNIPPGQVANRHLLDLHSSLEIPPPDKAQKTAIRFIHATFSEFLTDPSRSREFMISWRQVIVRHQLALAQRFLSKDHNATFALFTMVVLVYFTYNYPWLMFIVALRVADSLTYRQVNTQRRSESRHRQFPGHLDIFIIAVLALHLALKQK